MRFDIVEQEPVITGTMGQGHPQSSTPFFATPCYDVFPQLIDEDDHLFFEALHLGLQLADLTLVLGEPSLVLGRHDHFLLVAGVPRTRAGHYTGAPGTPWHRFATTFSPPWLGKCAGLVYCRVWSGICRGPIPRHQERAR